MADSSCGWSGYGYTSGICRYSTEVVGTWPNIKMRYHYAFYVYASETSSGSWSGYFWFHTASHNCTASWKGKGTFGPFVSGTIDIDWGTNSRKQTHAPGWGFVANGGTSKCNGTCSATHTLGLPSVYSVTGNKDITVNSANVTTSFTNAYGYYRYYLADTKGSGKTWHAYRSDSTTLSLTGLSTYTDYTIAMKVVDRNNNVVATGGATTSFKTLGISPVSVSSASVNIDSAVTINTNRYSDSFKHTITYSFGGLSGTIASNVEKSTSWTIPTSFYAQIPSSVSGVCTITCETFNGSTSIGKSTCTLTCNVANSIKPTVGTITNTENNSNVKSINSSVTLRYLSNKTVSVKPSAGTGSSVKSVLIQYGDQSKNATNSSGTWSATFSSLSDGEVTVTVIDNRNRQTSATASQTYYDYTYPTVSVSASRTSETSSNGSAKVTGTYWNKLSNSATLYFNRASSATTAVSPTLSSGNVTYSVSYTDLYYTSTFVWTVKITDKFGQSVTATYQLRQGRPTLWLGKDRVNIYNNLYVANAYIRDKIEQYDSVSWLFLGTWSGNSDNDDCIITYYGGSGWNGRTNQNTKVEIFIKNGWHSTPSASVGAFGGTAVVSHSTDSWNKIQFKLCATAHNSVNVYLYCPWQYSIGMFKVDITGGEFTKVNTAVTTFTGTEQNVKVMKEPSLLDDVYPIGAIYMSVSSTSPATLFGGSWEQLKNRFLVGAGDSYSLGATGGATSHTHTTAGHTLTVAEMPSHNHQYIPRVNWYQNLRHGINVSWNSQTNLQVDTTNDSKSNTYNSGGGASHSHGNTGSTSNMPPYLAVYMWKRTA